MLMLDRGSKFMTTFQEMVKNDYGTERKPMMVRNSQANATIERVHQTLGDMMQTSQIGSRDDFDDLDPWSGILTATAFAMRSMYHTMTHVASVQLVFGKDTPLNVQLEADMSSIKMCKQECLNRNNRRENFKCLACENDVDNKVLGEPVLPGKCTGNPHQ